MDANARQNVMLDILNWRNELAIAGDEEFSSEELEAYASELEDTTDAELEQWWMETVGEWVLSRNDMDIPADTDPETWLENAFEELQNSGNTQWGYIQIVDEAVLN